MGYLLSSSLGPKLQALLENYTGDILTGKLKTLNDSRARTSGLQELSEKRIEKMSLELVNLKQFQFESIPLFSKPLNQLISPLNSVI